MKKKGAEMTSPEKIEELLRRFGQTISDLPKAQTADYAYSKKDIGKAYGIATEWHGRYNSGSLDTGDFICHQSDVIKRLVAALETAEKIVSCEYCVKHESKCGNCSGYECTGFQMMDMEQIKKDMEARL